VTVASPSRSSDEAIPSRHIERSSFAACSGVSPTMKRCAMCRTPAAAAAPSAVRPARDSAIRIAARSGCGGRSTPSR
jgi:hypothetical protein